MDRVDGLLAYETQKVVRIGDRKLGCLRLSLIFIIIFYVLVWTMFVQGAHLKAHSGQGSFRSTLQHPTHDMCSPYDIDCSNNFTNLRSLPYCEEAPPSFGAPVRKRCDFWDGTELLRPVEDGFMIPTRLEMFKQRRSCQTGDCNREGAALYSFQNAAGKEQSGKGGAEPFSDRFVADIERYTLMVDHAFGAVHGAVNFDDREMLGYWMKCPPVKPGEPQDISACSEVPMMCVHSDCPAGALQPGQSTKPAQLVQEALRPKRALRLYAAASGTLGLGDAALETTEATLLRGDNVALSIGKGDVFSIGQILDMANAHDLDEDISNAKRAMTPRSRGMVVVMEIEYTNWVGSWTFGWLGFSVLPWTPFGRDPWYTVRVTKRPTTDYYTRSLEDFPDHNSGSAERLVYEWRGIRIIVKQTAHILAWDWTQLLVILSTSVGLLAVSNLIVDFCARHVMARSEEYQKAMVEERMSTMEKLASDTDG